MDTDTGCPVGILIDLSENVPQSTDNTGEDKENSGPVTEAIEVTRKASQVEYKMDVEDSLKQDIGDKDKGLQSLQSDSDVRLIDDEVFDFDLPDSPESAREGGKRGGAVDDEEVFFGPMGFTEKCIAAGVAEEAIQPLSPLRPDQVAELAKEAYSVACRIAMMNTSGDSVQGGSHAKSFKPLCRRKLTSLVQDNGGDSQVSSQESNGAAPDDEGVSPKKRKLSSTFSKESTEDSFSNSAGKGRQRTGTFTKEEPVESMMASSVMHHADQEQRTAAGGGAQRRSQATSRLQPPSKLRRYNNSQPNLSRPKEVAAGEEGEEQAAVPPMPRKSQQLPRAVSAGNIKRPGGGSRENSDNRGIREAGCNQTTALPTKLGLRRAHSTNAKSGLPSIRASKLALPSKSAAASSGQQVGAEKGVDTATSSHPSRKSSGIPKGPATKPQLMQPGQFQRKSFAMARAKGTAAANTGPLRAPAQPNPGLGNTVERPYNPALAAAAAAAEGNSQCPNTPAAKKSVPPRMLSLSSEASTPAKSSCSSSSACGSTPGSMNKRLSLLPLSARRRSGPGSLPPPSPRSVGSSSSSVSKRSLASSSDAADSPVLDARIAGRLAKSRRISGAKESCTSSDLDGPGTSPFAFKARKPLVQNTPDLPKRTLSRWSPVRKPKPVPLEDQVSMCTKRVSSKD